MSNIPLSLGYMPFEVLVNISGMLSSRDTSSMCRLSRTFDEMMAPVLYTAVEWDGPIYHIECVHVGPLIHMNGRGTD